MKFSGYNIEYTQFFSRNAFPLSITEIESTSINVTVTFDGADYNMTLTPDSTGSVVLDLQEICRSLSPKVVSAPDPRSTGRFTLLSSNVTISASGNSDDTISQSFIVIDGGVGDNLYPGEFQNSAWWTWRPEIFRAQKIGCDFLYCLLNTYEIETDATLFAHHTYAKLYMNSGEEVIVDLFTGMVSPESSYLLSVRVSYDRICDLLESTEYDPSDIVAYDVYGAYTLLNSTLLLNESPPVQRFILQPTSQKAKCFIFRNQMGVFDTVYSHGLFSRIVTPDVKTFITGRVESETNNNSKVSFKVNSGYIDSVNLVNQWQDFFLSDERYIVEDGSLKRIIVEEGKIDTKDLQLNNIEFTYHLAEQPAGRYREKTILNRFDYE